jgi:hypothetical protein
VDGHGRLHADDDVQRRNGGKNGVVVGLLSLEEADEDSAE